ncbi:hypothetical protein Mapa_012568 [Marchantia paleacea]|nr:hypothetical protein Mapa_012568 [Marchantia paleacea]
MQQCSFIFASSIAVNQELNKPIDERSGQQTIIIVPQPVGISEEFIQIHPVIWMSDGAIRIQSVRWKDWLENPRTFNARTKKLDIRSLSVSRLVLSSMAIPAKCRGVNASSLVVFCKSSKRTTFHVWPNTRSLDIESVPTLGVGGRSASFPPNSSGLRNSASSSSAKNALSKS